MDILVILQHALLLCALAQCKANSTRSDLIGSVPRGHPSSPMATYALPVSHTKWIILVLGIVLLSCSCTLSSLYTPGC